MLRGQRSHCWDEGFLLEGGFMVAGSGGKTAPLSGTLTGLTRNAAGAG